MTDNVKLRYADCRIRIAVITFLISIISGCDNDPHDRFLSGCCGNEPVIDSIGTGIVFIPNIFSPNGDGINDHFVVFGKSIRQIIALQIRDDHGRTVFHKSNIPVNEHAFGWDGISDGKLRRGLYLVNASIESIDGTVKDYTTNVCNYPCYLEGYGSERPTGGKCFYPSHANCVENDDGCYYADFDCF
jgi:gliding motility-associated-like protein